MKKLGIAILAIGLMLGLAACGKKQTPGGQVAQLGTVKLVSQDYVPGGIWGHGITERGIYQSKRKEPYGLTYLDFETGHSIYLCDKPECKHDGNSFCVATTKQYNYKEVRLYGDYLMIAAIEETETQYLFHILAVAADGSSLDNMVTVAKIEKEAIAGVRVTAFAVHRNMAVFGISMTGTKGLDDSVYNASFVVNLEAKEVVCLDKEVFDKENAMVSKAKGYGDSFFYVKESKKVKTLYRYVIDEEKEELLELPRNFTGDYWVKGDTVIYTNKPTYGFWMYQLDTKENKEFKFDYSDTEKMACKHDNPKKRVINQIKLYDPEEIRTDENFIYVFYGYLNYHCLEDEVRNVMFPVLVYDIKGNYIKTVDVGQTYRSLGEERYTRLETQNRIYLYDDIQGDYYYCVVDIIDAVEKHELYRCKLQDMIDGTGVLKLLQDDMLD